MAEDIKEKILSTAYALFRQRGVRDVTIDDICRSLSMSKKTFYQYYSQKEDLVAAAVDVHLEEKRRYFENILRGRNPVEVLWVMTDMLARKKTADSDSRMAADIRKYYPDIFIQKTKSRKAEGMRIFLEIIYQGMEAGYVRRDLDPEAAVLQLAFMHQGMILYQDSLSGGRRVSYRRVCLAFLDVVAHALFTAEGWEIYNSMDKNEE